jgi:hypothetical protein
MKQARASAFGAKTTFDAHCGVHASRMARSAVEQLKCC